MVKRQRQGVWVLFAIFGLAAILALFMFSKPQLTGNVVVGDVTCDGTWTCTDWSSCDGTTQTRTCESSDTTNCIGSSPVTESQSCEVVPTCSDGILNQDETEIDCGGAVCSACPVCDTTHLSLCLTNETCSVATGFWYNELCNVETQPVCDTTHLSLCLDEPTCTTATGFWYNSLCNAQAQPVSCSEDWSCGDWSECSDGLKTRSCTDANSCGTTGSKPSISNECTEEGLTTTTTTSTTTATTETIVTPSVCSPGLQQCANGNLYLCNSAGTGWNPSQTCELGCSGSACIVETAPVVPAETCEDGLKNQDEQGVDCGGVCTKKCSIFVLAGSVVSAPVESGKQLITNFFSNKTRAYAILGGTGVLIAGFVACFVFRKRLFK